jgi:hypothetical protein
MRARDRVRMRSRDKVRVRVRVRVRGLNERECLVVGKQLIYLSSFERYVEMDWDKDQKENPKHMTRLNTDPSFKTICHHPSPFISNEAFSF